MPAIPSGEKKSGLRPKRARRPDLPLPSIFSNVILISSPTAPVLRTPSVWSILSCQEPVSSSEPQPSAYAASCPQPSPPGVEQGQTLPPFLCASRAPALRRVCSSQRLFPGSAAECGAQFHKRALGSLGEPSAAWLVLGFLATAAAPRRRPAGLSLPPFLLTSARRGWQAAAPGRLWRRLSLRAAGGPEPGCSSLFDCPQLRGLAGFSPRQASAQV